MSHKMAYLIAIVAVAVIPSLTSNAGAQTIASSIQDCNDPPQEGCDAIIEECTNREPGPCQGGSSNIKPFNENAVPNWNCVVYIDDFDVVEWDPVTETWIKLGHRRTVVYVDMDCVNAAKAKQTGKGKAGK